MDVAIISFDEPIESSGERMQYTISLNKLYADYTAGLLKKNDFEAAFFKYLQENVNQFRLPEWSREDCDDFISWLYLRLRQGITNYRETGASFETYIGAFAKLAVKEYRFRQIRDYIEESAAWVTQIPNMYACESEVEYCERISAEKEKPLKLKNPRQILILILKCCNYVSAELLEKVSLSLNISPELLHKMVGHLKEQRIKRDKDFTALCDLAGHQLYRCILFEQSLRAMTDFGMDLERVEKKLEKGRKRLKKTRRRIAHSRLEPTNSQIAELLGISKGTVDSALYNLKARWKKENSNAIAHKHYL